MKKVTIYGIKSITVNNVLIHTCKVCIKNSEKNKNILSSNHVSFMETDKKLIISLTTFDAALFNLFVQNMGKALKEVALNNVNNKYSWVCIH